jgi:hypothetical protein
LNISNFRTKIEPFKNKSRIREEEVQLLIYELNVLKDKIFTDYKVIKNGMVEELSLDESF